jgi:hypothetical protein
MPRDYKVWLEDISEMNKDPRSKFAGYSEKKLNSQIPLTPFSKGELNSYPGASYGE